MNHKLLCLILGAIVLAAYAKKEEPAKPAPAPAPAPAPSGPGLGVWMRSL